MKQLYSIEFSLMREATDQDSLNAQSWQSMHKPHKLSLLHEDKEHPDVIDIIGGAGGVQADPSVPIVNDPFADVESETKSDIINVDKETIEVVNEYHAYCSACRYHIYNSCDPSDTAASFVDHVNSSKHIGQMLMLDDNYFNDDGLFKVSFPSAGTWACTACCEDVPKTYKKKSQKLKETVEEHIRLPSHKESVELFTNESKTFLMTLATKKPLCSLLQFSQYSENAFCKLCQMEFYKYDGFKHIESKRHLDYLENSLKELEEAHMEPLRKLKIIETKYKTQPGRLFLNIHPIVLPKYEHSPDAIIDYHMKMVLSKSWTHFVPHPDTVKNSKITNLTEKYAERSVKVVNDAHAVCLICRYHIVSETSMNDLGTLFFKHISSPEHLHFEERYPTNQKMLNSSRPNCEACEKNFIKIFLKRPLPLAEAIDLHLQYFTHTSNESILKSVGATVLVGIAITPMMRYITMNSNETYCNFCKQPLPRYHQFNHCRTKRHLKNVAAYLVRETGLEINDTVTEDTIYDIIKFLVHQPN